MTITRYYKIFSSCTGIESQRSHHVVLLELATTKFFSATAGFWASFEAKADAVRLWIRNLAGLGSTGVSV
jgi:hypothetical protein